MSQLSLFPKNPTEKQQDQKLWYKVRCSNFYKRISQDKIFTFTTQEEAQMKIEEWNKQAAGNNGYIYQERVTQAFMNELIIEDRRQDA
ncbi:MAG: hypothetical protein EBS07_10420 [Sphingobacteriia bacterium]|nr:hypothetical protein [Sphingobacteriia bacterium]